MKKLLCLAFAAVLFGCLAGEIRAGTLEIGARFPVENISNEQKTSDNTIIAFMPSVTYECEYASMLTRSFYYYFDRQMAFEGLKKSPTTQIFLVVRDKVDLIGSTQNIFGGMTVIYDEKGELFTSFGVKQPASKNADTTVVLLDSNKTIAHIDQNYRAQGEHLKPLENKLRELNGIYRKAASEPSPKALKVGDKAPDFRVNDKEMLSDLRGKVVLLSFYPAAFSGTLPKPAEFGALDLKNFKFPIDDSKLMACTLQLDSLDKAPETKTEARRIVISSSTGALLDEWQKTLKTENIEYANDADYSVSLKYLSYNPNGYNNRVSVIVDRNGRIAYIDKDFELKDEAVLNAKIDELSKK
jgi:peroxiredoxin